MEPDHVGRLIDEHRQRRELSLTELAGGARMHRTTLYRIIRGATAPRLGTLRSIARALQIPLVTLTEQIEISSLEDRLPEDNAVERLLLRHFSGVPKSLREQAAYIAITAMVDVHMGLGERPDRHVLKRLAKHSARSKMTKRQLDDLLVEQVRRLPRLLQRLAAREAIVSMIDLELRERRTPSPAVYRVIGHRQLRPRSERKEKPPPAPGRSL